MNDILSGISEILDNPEASKKISDLAKSISASQPISNSNETSPEISPASAPASASLNVSNLMSSLSGINFNLSQKHITLLNAIKPYLRPSRSEKISAALKAISVLNSLSNIK